MLFGSVGMDSHSGNVKSVGFSPDGTRIVSGSADSRIKLWGGWRARSRYALVCSHSGSVRCGALNVWACGRFAPRRFNAGAVD
eukprot:3729406-Prymnesium_polylepis.7